MRLTVLVNSQRLLSRLGTGTSYLLRSERARVVLDAANGAERAMRMAPLFESSQVVRVGLHLGQWDLMGAPGSLHG